jgi:plasmid stabilization system protein ParE
MIDISWSNEAIADFEQNINFLEKRFSDNEVIDFIDKTQEVIIIISRNPKAFKVSTYKKVHVVPIVPQVSLFYSILNKNSIVLLRFWNNYQKPEKLDL